MHWQLLTVLSVVCINAVAEVPCPTKCSCNLYEETTITCTGITNEELLRMKFPPEYVTLNLENNQLSEFPPKQNFVNNTFTSILLSHNKFSEVPDFPDTVTNVRLNNNTLSGELMSSNFTTWIKNADSIDLSRNNITGIHSHAFAASTKLSQLELGYNQIKYLHRDAFVDLTAVENLRLESNLISTLAPGLFDGMKKLNRLDLSENQLATIRAEFFANAPLKWLLLNKNRISKIAPGSFGNELKSVHLFDNLLTTISTNWYVNVSAHAREWQWSSLLMTGNEFNCSCMIFNAATVLKQNHIDVTARCYDQQRKYNAPSNRPKYYVNLHKGPFPCLHNGECSEDRESYNCTCTKDYKGNICRYAKTLCDYNPCHHNATCTDLMTKNYVVKFTCNCTRGYKGKACDIIDECYKDRENVCNSGSGFKPLRFIGHLYFFVLLAKFIWL